MKKRPIVKDERTLPRYHLVWQARPLKMARSCPLPAVTGQPVIAYLLLGFRQPDSPATFGSAHIGRGLSPDGPRSLATAGCLLLRFGVFCYPGRLRPCYCHQERFSFSEDGSL